MEFIIIIIIIIIIIVIIIIVIIIIIIIISSSSSSSLTVNNSTNGQFGRPGWSRTLKLFTKTSQFVLGTKAVLSSWTSGGSASLRYQPVGRYNISQTSVSFRY